MCVRSTFNAKVEFNSSKFSLNLFTLIFTCCSIRKLYFFLHSLQWSDSPEYDNNKKKNLIHKNLNTVLILFQRTQALLCWRALSYCLLLCVLSLSLWIWWAIMIVQCFSDEKNLFKFGIMSDSIYLILLIA